MFFISLLLLGLPFTKSIRVDIHSGAVIGSTVYYNGKPINRFLGIPFAKPPVGNLRFKKTQPIQPWSKPLQAFNYPASCVQYYPFHYPWVDKMPDQSEDCLYLNIWAPSPNDSSRDLKAVMFWVYSGGFSYGSNRLPVYDGHVLAEEGDVIVVTINYRLGILGFLSLDTEEAPGNMGFLDIVSALKWVNGNIQAFGGNKDKITVFGQSAGSIIAGYLTMSPIAKGLFHRIIMQSGSPLYATGNPEEHNFILAQKTASAFRCASNITTLKERPRQVVACLRTINAEILVKTVNSFDPGNLVTYLGIYGDEFLPLDPRIALKTGAFQDVDVLAGNVEDEGSILMVTAFPELFGPYGEHDPKINKTLGKYLILKMFENLDFKQDVADYYLSDVDETDFDAVRTQTYHSKGDFRLFCPMIYFVESFAAKKKKKTYFYYFDHQNYGATIFASWMGKTHFSEVPYVFGQPLDHLYEFTEAEARLSKKMVRMWTSFAKCGVPDQSWKEFSTSNPYVEQLYVTERDDNYLKQHLENCDFYRPYREYF